MSKRLDEVFNTICIPDIFDNHQKIKKSFIPNLLGQPDGNEIAAFLSLFTNIKKNQIDIFANKIYLEMNLKNSQTKRTNKSFKI